jgi:hypothetical protein
MLITAVVWLSFLLTSLWVYDASTHNPAIPKILLVAPCRAATIMCGVIGAIVCLVVRGVLAIFGF